MQPTFPILHYLKCRYATGSFHSDRLMGRWRSPNGTSGFEGILHVYYNNKHLSNKRLAWADLSPTRPLSVDIPSMAILETSPSTARSISRAFTGFRESVALHTGQIQIGWGVTCRNREVFTNVVGNSCGCCNDRSCSAESGLYVLFWLNRCTCVFNHWQIHWRQKVWPHSKLYVWFVSVSLLPGDGDRTYR